MKYKFWMSSTQSTEDMLKDANDSKPTDEMYDEDDTLIKLKEGEVGIRSDTGELITRKDGVLQICGTDENFVTVYNKYQGALRYKDNTAFKIIERTSKAHVWARAASYLERAIKDGNLQHTLEFFKIKAESHREYLAEQVVDYNFATQNFTPKETV